MFPIEKCEKIQLPQGAIYLGPSTKNKSVGYLELNPHTSLTLHNRPAVEKLTQVKNKCAMVIFEKKSNEIVILQKGGQLIIEPPNTWHIHANYFGELSLTYWDFEGDIRSIIQNIREQK